MNQPGPIRLLFLQLMSEKLEENKIEKQYEEINFRHFFAAN